MPKLVRLLRVFISSPADLIPEKEIIETEINELNLVPYQNPELRLELVRWETHSYPEMGEDAQHKINKQIGDEYDIFVGLMWARFGTPTNRAGSGSEEEFNRAYDRYLREPHRLRILYYFKDTPIPPSQITLEQLSKVNEFRERLSHQGLFWKFNSPEEFRQQVSRHLRQHLQEFGKSWGLDEPKFAANTESQPPTVPGAEGIRVLSSKKSFARINTELSHLNKSFLVSYPVVVGIDSEEVLQRINSLLSYERVFDISFKEEIEGGALTSLDFEVNYLRGPFLDITLMMEGVGAYPWWHSKTLVINLETGQQVTANDLFEKTKMRSLASLVNELVKLDKKKAQLMLAYESGEEAGDFGPEAFGVDDLDHFSLDDFGITFKFNFQFPHVIKAFEPDGTYYFSYDSLKRFLKSDGMLDILRKTSDYE